MLFGYQAADNVTTPPECHTERRSPPHHLQSLHLGEPPYAVTEISTLTWINRLCARLERPFVRWDIPQEDEDA